MRTFSLTAGAFCICVCGTVSAWALEVPSRQQQVLALPTPGTDNPLGQFKSGRDALRVGVREYNAGDKIGAARALEYAASEGQALALWKLGRMYAEGDGVAQDELKAFELFSKLADQYADVSSDSATAPVVSSAFVALGGYFVNGIKGSYVHQDLDRAREMFHYAATYFSDPDAQYSLARLYIDGSGVEKDPRLAARWLKLAAGKGHYPSQALLGYLLIKGEGVPREPARGFMWLSMARDSAYDAKAPVKNKWIFELYDKAETTLPENDRTLALSYVEQYAVEHRR